jgi:hypothetical protein
MSVNLDTMSDEDFEAHMNNLPKEEEEEAVIEDTEPTDTVEDETTTDDDQSEEEESATEEEETESQTTDSDEEENDSTEDTEEDTQETTEIDYKAFYEQVTADYKANNRVMPGLKDPEDFRKALAMASNYALKTTAIKPHLGRIKMLKDVSDEELNEMMDFKNRNPEVIKKALKDAGIDPLDIDVDEKVSYQANDYRVSTAEIEFEEIIDTIKDTPEFARTSEVVTSVWDEASKRAMLDNPHLIKALNEEMQMGRYDTIQGMIDQRKLLGKTGGMTDLQMYQEIATEMQRSQMQQPTKKVEVVAPVQKVEDPAVKEQKKQAGISTKKTSSAVKKYDPTKLSDEEFMELVASGAKFI